MLHKMKLFHSMLSRTIWIRSPQSTRAISWLYTEFIMADGSGKPRYENMETRRLRVATQINMATPGENMFTAPVSLTETDIPGASSHGRKPAEMKKADVLFWLRCRGDSCKGMTVKAQLVKRYVCICCI